jgi:glycine oxidase
VARSAEPLGWTDAEGHELWRAHGDGGVTVSGSRMLPVERELAPRGGTSPEVQALLESNLREFPHLAAHRIDARGAAVQAVPCDVLPLVGPVPGRPRVLVLAGFGRNSPGLALVAAEVVAQLLLSGRADHATAFSPRRFL